MKLHYPYISLTRFRCNPMKSFNDIPLVLTKYGKPIFIIRDFVDTTFFDEHIFLQQAIAKEERKKVERKDDIAEKFFELPEEDRGLNGRIFIKLGEFVSLKDFTKATKQEAKEMVAEMVTAYKKIIKVEGKNK